jgi:hypothetical protein
VDKSLAILLGKISKFVYTPSDDELAELGAPSLKLFSDPGLIQSSFAGILRYPDKTVLAYKGTVNDPIVTGVRDWLANFSAALVPPIKFPGLVHLGFIDQLRLIHDDMVADLNTGFTPPLYVTGHSQGGAVAALATKALEHDGIEVAATYTFAAPLPCENIFKSSVKTPVFRLEFGDDIVPHVPLEALPLPVEMALKSSPELGDLLGKITSSLGYTAVGKLTYGAPGQPLRINLSPVEEKALRLKRLPHLAVAGPNVFRHHAMTHYISMLE